MELTFQKALYAAGGILIVIGLFMGFMTAGLLEQSSDIGSALSAGVTAAYFALFSGVLIGVGAALAATGCFVSGKTRKARTGSAALFCFATLLSLLLFYFEKPSSYSFAMLLLSIAVVIFGISMLVAALFFYFVKKE